MREFQEQYIVNKKGQKTAVILHIDEYEEILEDLHDIAIVAERRDESTIDFEELKRRLIRPTKFNKRKCFYLKKQT